jgi:hypothetical protein
MPGGGKKDAKPAAKADDKKEAAGNGKDKGAAKAADKKGKGKK